jgi:DNA-binding NarL/FixJ family response regulator
VTRILLVDDHAAVRQPLAILLDRETGLEVVGQAGSLAEARALLPLVAVDVAVVDLRLPDGDGADLITDVRAASPRAAVLVLTGVSERRHVARAVEAGAAGVVHKASAPAEVVAAIRRLGTGEPLLAPAEVAELRELARQERAEREAAARAVGRLTRRERDVLRVLGRGRTNEEIARALHVEVDTVKSHVASILRKLEVGSRVEAALFAVHQGLDEAGPDPGASDRPPLPGPRTACERA